VPPTRLDHRRVDLGLRDPLDRLHVQRVFGRAGVAPADHEHAAGPLVPQAGERDHHLVADELRLARDVHDAV
jgi:hypothetical protein